MNLNGAKLDNSSFIKDKKVICKSAIKDDIFQISLNDSNYYKFKIKEKVTGYLNSEQHAVDLFMEDLASNVANFIEKEVDEFVNKMYLYS